MSKTNQPQKSVSETSEQSAELVHRIRKKQTEPETVIYLDDLAKKVLGKPTGESIDKIDLTEMLRPRYQRKTIASITMVGNRIFYSFSGSLSRKKAVVVGGLGTLMWFLIEYIFPFLAK